MSRRYEGGDVYAKKGVVTHMLGRSACQVRMDGTGRVLDEVKERHLENALPKVGSPAMVLLGEHRELMKKPAEQRQVPEGKVYWV